MNWEQLLSLKRFGDTNKRLRKEQDETRLGFEVDYDRVIFSSEFRSLQDKTQVIPLSQTDFVHTRLTHSLEVSVVGRSLGRRVGLKVLEKHPHLQNIHGFFTCVNTSHYVDKNIEPNPKPVIEFSADLNKTSLKNINKKNITTINSIIPNKSINEVLYINYISSYLLKKGQYKELVTLLKKYKSDLTIKDIELLVKIDKTAKKYVLSSKYKKVLNHVLNNI